MDQHTKTLNKGKFQDAVYHDIGSGTPVMLVHGFPADSHLWHFQANQLKKDFRLLIPDLPGSGRSPLKGDGTMEDMADFLYEILKDAGAEKCILIGHSMGGYIALAFVEKYPGSLKGVGLFHSSAWADTPDKKKGRKRSIQMMKQYGAGVFLRQMMPSLFSQAYKNNHKAEMKVLIKSKENADANALAAYYKGMMNRPDRTGALRQTKVPVLFVIGEEDTAAPAKDVLKQVAVPAISDVRILSDAAHMGMLEKPEITTEILKNFICLCLDIK